MARFKTAGSSMFIGSAPMAQSNSLVEADFAAVEWIEIDNHTDLGTFGATRQLITTNEVKNAWDIKASGTRNAGSQTLTLNINTADPGQQKLLSAADDGYDYPIKVVFPDAPPTGANPAGSERKYLAIVMGVPENLGGPNNFATTQVTLEINSNIVRKAATANAGS